MRVVREAGLPTDRTIVSSSLQSVGSSKIVIRNPLLA